MRDVTAMKTIPSLLCLAVLTWAAESWAVDGIAQGTITGDRVNVRGQATLQSEVISQLRTGETVTILEEVVVSKPRTGEPAAWLRILMPTNTPVWVHSSFVDPTNHVVKPVRLNVRGGPGENFSVVGRIERGLAVQVIGVTGDWMEIVAPPGCYGFVASDFVDVTSGGAPPAPATPTTQSSPSPAPPIAQTPTPKAAETAPPVVAVPPPIPPTTAPSSPPPAVTTDAPPATPPLTSEPASSAAADEPLPKRVVVREGKVSRTLSIQAPTFHELESLENGKPLNYLDVTRLPIRLENFRGRKIQVTGEEKVDARWPKVPVIEVESIRLVP